MDVSFDEIVAARERIHDGVLFTPCPESVPLSELCGCQVFCKLEYLQRTGSFKERGARNALSLLSPDRKARGVIAASAGNHALGLAYHGGMFGIPVTVVMPRFAPLIKQTQCGRLAAKVILHGDSFADARAEADRIAGAEGLTYIHGYDDPAIIAGQGTIGLEIMEQVPDADAIVVPIGGGGLIAGIALAMKTIRPDVHIIGVEPEQAACFSAALRAGHPEKIQVQPTLADGLAIAQVGANALNIARDRIDRVVLVSEEELALAVLRLVELEKSVVEGAGAAALAPFLGKKLPELAGKRVVLVLSGGNIDPAILSRLIEHGLVADDRLCRFTAVISDRPGGLAKLARLIAEVGASVKEITHERAFGSADVSAVTVVCTVETRDRAHIEELYSRLQEERIRYTPFRHGS
ncbi:MAG TPA: threonine ammonia-lyase [Planctomycetaceae bacterium]|nr:threonine ammonia-lyase [Planctomycetaceae bacterium]